MKFTRDHEWIEKCESLYILGITAFAAKELGELVFVELPEENKTYTKGSVLAVVESTKTSGDVYAPFDLEVVEVNKALRSDPALINRSPYTDGWICKIKCLDDSQLNELLDELAYKSLIQSE
ncbi:MAG: glycine cleavage system protein GcvH [Deltaproteobacteria bacterium]|nr:glycine cleavage system protein GcvH [Deltaproteobacteria bacterium]